MITLAIIGGPIIHYNLIHYFKRTAQSWRIYSQLSRSSAQKRVVKRVEDRSRNVVVFGLSEGSDSELVDSVSEIFQKIGQKPTIVEACRIGRKSKDNTVTTLPDKVKVSSSIVVDQLVANAKNLRITEKFKTVFVSPDRAPENRQIQRDWRIERQKRRIKCFT